MSDEDDLKLARKSLDGDASALIRLIDRRIGLAFGTGDEDVLGRARKIVDMMKMLRAMDENPSERNRVVNEALDATLAAQPSDPSSAVDFMVDFIARNDPARRSGPPPRPRQACGQCVDPMLKGIHTCYEHAPRCQRCAHMEHSGYHCGESVMSMGAESEMCECPP